MDDGIVVQIDQSIFRHKQKYHVGRQPERKIWVFELADVSFTPAKISLHIVEDRNASTLLPIIEQVCIPGSIIHSDQWRGYRSINQRFRFAHQTVNHTESFVDPITGAHTQSMKSI